MAENIKIMVINGPNLNLLGIREPEIYGNRTYADLEAYIEEYCSKHGIEVTILQSNSEGEIIDFIHHTLGNYDGIIINPAAYTHYSYAIHDALKSVDAPSVEVHLSDIQSREEFRRVSVTAPACIRQIAGHGFDSYIMAAECITNTIRSGDKNA